MKNLKLTLSTLAAGLVGVSSIAALTTLTSCNEGEKWDTVLSSKDEADAYLAAHVHKISSIAKSAASATDSDFLTTLKNGINTQNLLNGAVLASELLQSDFSIFSFLANASTTSIKVSLKTLAENQIKVKSELTLTTDGDSATLTALLSLTLNEDHTVSGSNKVDVSASAGSQVLKDQTINNWVLSRNLNQQGFDPATSYNTVFYVKPGAGATSEDKLDLPLSGRMDATHTSSWQDTEGLTFATGGLPDGPSESTPGNEGYLSNH